MLKKIISSWMTLLAALLLVGCTSSNSTNHKTNSASTEVAKKNEISITVTITPDGQSAQSKTLKVEENSQDEAKGLYWMYKINGEMAPKGAVETTVKKGDKIKFYQEVYK